MPQTAADEMRALLAAPPAAAPAPVDEMRSLLGLTGAAERSQLAAEQSARETRDLLRDAGQPIRTAPLQGFTAGVDHGWTVQDTHALSQYGVKVDPDINPHKRATFIKNFNEALKVGEQLPFVYENLADDLGDPQRGPILQNKINSWAAALYNIHHQQPSGEETLQAVRDGFFQWMRGVSVGFKDTPGLTRPPVPMSVPPGTTDVEVQNLFAKWKGTGTDYFTPDEKRLFDSIRGPDAFKFIDSSVPYYVTRGRLEKTLGRQIEDRNQPVTLPVDPAHPDEDILARRREFPLHVEHLAEKDLDLGFLTQLSQAKVQASAEAAAFAKTHTVPLAIPGFSKLQFSTKVAFNDLGQKLEHLEVNVAPVEFGSVSMETAINSPAISRPLFTAGMHGLLWAAAPLKVALLFESLPYASQVGFNVLDRLSATVTGQDGLVSAGSAKALGYLTRGIAPYFSQSARNDQAFAARVIDQFPAGTPAERIQDTLKLIPAASSFNQLLDAAAKSDVPVLNLFAQGIQSNPFLEEQLGGLAGATDNPAEAVALAIGFTAVPGYLASRLKLKGVPDPFTRYGKYDYTSQTGSAAEAARGGLVDLLDKKVRTLRRPDDAAELIDRTTKMLRTEGGGITAEETGAVLKKLEDIKKTTDALSDAKVTQATREALADPVKSVADIGPTEALYAATGKAVPLGAEESARINAKLLAAAEQVKEGGPASPILEFVRDSREIDGAVRAVHDKIARDQEAVARHDRAISLVDEAAGQIQARAEPRARQVSGLHRAREGIVEQWNDDIQQALHNTEQYDKFGGVRYKPGGAGDVLIEVPVEANASPKRAELRQRIADKIEAARADKALVQLEPAELAALNEHRNTPLDQKATKRSYDAAGADLRTHKDSITTDTHDLKALSRFRQTLLAHDPQAQGRPLEVPKAARRVLERELASKAADLTASRYASIHPGYPTATLTALQALDELIGRLKQDVVDAGSSLRRLSEFHSKILLNTNRGDFIWALHRNMRDGQDYARFVLTEARRAAKMSGDENITFDEVIHQAYEATQGRGTSPYAKGKMRELREYVGRGWVDTGIVDRATVEKWIDDPTYLHGVLSPDDISRLPPAIHHPLGDWNRLTIKGDYLKAAIPEAEGEYHVVYKKDGQLRFKEGFKSPAEAKAWLDSGAEGLDRTTSVDIRKNLTLSEKLIRGIVGDPTISYLSLMQKAVRDIERARLNMDLARTPFVKSEADLATQPIEFVNENTARDRTTGKTWRRVTSPSAIHLTDKFIHEDALTMLDLRDVGLDFFKETTEGIQAGTGFWDLFRPFSSKTRNPLMTMGEEFAARLARAGGKEPSLFGKIFLRTPANILAYSRVATSPISWLNQWPANLLLNMPLAGLETLHAGNWSFILRAAGEYLDHVKTGQMPRALELERNGSIQHSKAEFVDELKGLISRYHTDPARLAGRMEFHRRRAAELESAGDFETAAQHIDHAAGLEKRLNEIEPKSAGGFLREFAEWGMKATRNLFDAAVRAKGPLHQGAWDIFALPDNISKYATHKYLVEVKGLSVAESLSRIDTFMQNLHRSPRFVKNLANQIGGGLFLSYRANALQVGLNALRYRPGFVAARALTVAGWNTLALAMGGDDVDDAINRFSYVNYGVKANPATTAHFLTSRILLPGGRGGLSLGNTFFDIFAAKSQLGRNVATMINKQDWPFYTKASAHLVNGLTSQFYGSHPTMNVLANGLKWTDAHGRPFRNPADFALSTMRDFAPAAGIDAWEIGARAAGYRFDNYTAQRQTWQDYVIRRLGGINPQELSDAVMLRAAIDQQVLHSRDPGEWISSDNSRSLRQTYLAEGVFEGGDPASAARRVELAREHFAQKGRNFLQLGKGTQGMVQSEEKILAAVRGARLPGTYSDFHRLTLPEMMYVYSNLRSAVPQIRDTGLDVQIRQIMVDRASSDAILNEQHAYDTNGQPGANIQTAATSIGQDPGVPKNVRGFIGYVGSTATSRIDAAALKHKR